MFRTFLLECLNVNDLPPKFAHREWKDKQSLRCPPKTGPDSMRKIDFFKRLDPWLVGQIQLVSGMLVNCAGGTRCNHFSNDRSFLGRLPET